MTNLGVDKFQLWAGIQTFLNASPEEFSSAVLASSSISCKTLEVYPVNASRCQATGKVNTQALPSLPTELRHVHGFWAKQAIVPPMDNANLLKDQDQEYGPVHIIISSSKEDKIDFG